MTVAELEYQIQVYGQRVRDAYGYDYWQGWVTAMRWMIEKLEASE